MSNVKVYIDGFNFYHAVEKIGDSRLKWINYRTLALTLLRPGEELIGTVFFTAIWRFNQAKQLRHMNFIAAQRHSGVEVIEGNFVTPNKFCAGQNRYCPIREEKQTDVAIAVEIVKDVMSGNIQRVILITADSDQIPTAKFVASVPNVSMSLYAPPGRLQEARDLGNLIPDRSEISVGRLLTCRLPRNLIDGRGRTIASCPAIYEIEF